MALKRTRTFGGAEVARRRKRRRITRARRRTPALGVELKFYDKSLIGSVLATNTDASGGEHDPSSTILLNTVVRGDGEENRDGRKIVMRSIYLTGTISCISQANQSSADNGALIFISLVLDKQTNGITIDSEDVYVNPGADALTSSSLMRNLKFVTRFTVLATVKLNMDNVNLAFSGNTDQMEQSGLIRSWEIYRKLNIPVLFSSGTGETVANIVDNSLHLLAWTTSATMAPLISYNSRLRFVG